MLVRIGLIDEGIFEQEKCVCPTKSSVKLYRKLNRTMFI